MLPRFVWQEGGKTSWCFRWYADWALRAFLVVNSSLVGVFISLLGFRRPVFTFIFLVSDLRLVSSIFGFNAHFFSVCAEDTQQQQKRVKLLCEGTISYGRPFVRLYSSTTMPWMNSFAKWPTSCFLLQRQHRHRAMIQCKRIALFWVELCFRLRFENYRPQANAAVPMETLQETPSEPRVPPIRTTPVVNAVVPTIPTHAPRKSTRIHEVREISCCISSRIQFPLNSFLLLASSKNSSPITCILPAHTYNLGLWVEKS